MPNVTRTSHPQPLILIATTERWRRQELSSVLTEGGFRVTTAIDERETLEQAQAQSPQAIVVDVGVAPPGYGLCSTLRTVSLATPIILIVPGEVTRAEQLEAFRAGAWAVLGTPLDADALLLHIVVFIEPKLELERVSEECLVDRVSGLYNPSGLTRRAGELAALATRQGLALTCAVFRPDAKLPNQAAGDRLALAFKSVGRVSDALGRTGKTEFTVFAPASNTWAAARLVRRMTESVEREFGSLREGNKRVGVRAGYSAALAHQISPATLLTRARHALESPGASK
jgi:PleD family two-component response regulator